MAVGVKLDALVSAPIPWLCKRRMPGFALSQLFRGDLCMAMPSLATCSHRVRSKLVSANTDTNNLPVFTCPRQYSCK